MLEKVERELKKSIFKKSYYEFFKWSFKLLFPNEPFIDTFHIKYLCDVYQAEIERMLRNEEKTKDIIVNIPPRSTKTLITSVILNAWVWIEYPTCPFICVSFDNDLANLNAQYCKDIINLEEYQELYSDRFYIRREYNGKEFFMNDKGGFRLSKTTGSNITGHKAAIIIVDDPQSPKTSESEVFRKAAVSYYKQALYNRLTPIQLGVRIIIMQRLHADDLSGNLLNDPVTHKLNSKNKNYHHICLPAEVSDLVHPPELKQYYIDGLLDRNRLSKKILQGLKETLGTRGYAGQYEQNPSPAEGGILKVDWFDIVRPEFITRDQGESPIHFILDTAYTMKTENDPTAIMTCFRQGNHLYVLDCHEVWLEFPDLIKYIITHVNRFQYSSNSKLFIEPKASGKSVAQQLRTQTMLNVVELPAPTDDKVARANAIAPTVESRRVRLIDGSYIPNFLEQIRLFPNATHDDMIDDLIYGVNELLITNNPDFLFL